MLGRPETQWGHSEDTAGSELQATFRSAQGCSINIISCLCNITVNVCFISICVFLCKQPQCKWVPSVREHWINCMQENTFQQQVATQDAFYTHCVKCRCEVASWICAGLTLHASWLLGTPPSTRFYSVTYFTMVALNSASREVNQVRQVNPLGSDRWERFPVSLSPRRGERHWQIRCTGVCDAVVNGNVAA